jgi:hypothetical protein
MHHMARQIRSPSLATPTARLKLAVRKKPYTVQLAPEDRASAAEASAQSVV